MKNLVLILSLLLPGSVYCQTSRQVPPISNFNQLNTPPKGGKFENLKTSPLKAQAKSLTQRKSNASRSALGGVDAGGNNSINGRTLEQIQQATFEIQGWNEVVVPLLGELELSIPNFGRHLVERARDLKWYLVDQTLDQLPREKTGIPVASDQEAIQLDNEVYVNKKLFNKRSVAEKGAFIIHELVEAQYFRIKKNEDYLADGFRKRITMANVRAISKILDTYHSSQQSLLQKELYDQNFGFYISLNEVASIEAEFIDSLKKIQVACSQNPSSEIRTLYYFSLIITNLYLGYLPSYAFLTEIHASVIDGTLDTRRVERDQVYSFNFLEMWNQYSSLFPEAMVSTKIDFSGWGEPSLMEVAFPNAKGTQKDFDEAEKVCEKLKSFDLSKFRKTTQPWHSRP